VGIRGIDISEHQRTMDVERVVRENGIDFAFVRTNYGANHDDLYFHAHADAAERGGAIVLPYVYILASDIRGSIDDCVRIIGGRYDSVIVDWEDGSGGGAELRQAHELLWERGFSTPVVYDPKWYWESVGSPDLSWMRGKVRGHWKSWYADRDARSFDDALSRVQGYVWDDARGGIPTLIVQFTGTGRLSGYGANLDLNYFPGTRQELAALLGGGTDMLKDEIVNVVRPDTNETWPENAAVVQGYLMGTVNFLRDNAIAQSEVLAQIAERDDRVQLDAEQLAALRTGVTGDLRGVVEESIVKLGDFLVDKLGVSEDTVKSALRDFYGVAVDAA
jgi:glycosyl hydrolase family 25